MATDPVAAIRNWARQTVIFAIGLRNDPSTASLPGHEQAKRALDEGENVCKTLWTEAQTLCATDLNRIPKVYPKLVLKWVQQNIPLTD